ncbi:unnamed protein product [Clonostachys rhizophaga]|uniref:Amino acid transporter transmembrane domain-containing protein n=1 Tax=Clonostachys rhizophaga TaxID=160324 RepID=A0A9N9YQL0_9HYPO|nr:unnamed protein product [Clonostachys rhizophaga]
MSLLKPSALRFYPFMYVFKGRPTGIIWLSFSPFPAPGLLRDWQNTPSWLIYRAVCQQIHLHPALSTSTRALLRHWATWLSCTFGCATVSYIIASAVPSFGSLASLNGAFFGTLLCFHPMACMWLYDNWSAGKQDRPRWWMVQVCLSGFVIVAGTIILAGGTYGSVLSIKEVSGASVGYGAFSCADNSHS